MRGVARRLLLIEDEHDTREMLALLLEASGFEVTTAATAHDAAGTLAAHAFDLVITDLLSDGTSVDDSWDAIDGLLRLAGPTPVGLVSGWPRVFQQKLDRRVAFCLLKPVASVDLLAAVSSAIDLPPVTPERIAVIRNYFAAIESGDYDALAGVCTESVVYNLPGEQPQAATVVGRDAFREFSRATFEAFSRPEFVLGTVRPLPDGALVSYVGSWTDSQGLRQVAPGHVLFVFSGVQIREIGVRVDLARNAHAVH